MSKTLHGRANLCRTLPVTAATRFGRPLPSAGTIGVAAPASPYDARSEIERGVEWWEAQGYRVKLAGSVLRARRLRRRRCTAARRRPDGAVRRSRGRRRPVPAGRLRLGTDDPAPRLRRHRREPEAVRRLLRHHGAPRGAAPARRSRHPLRLRAGRCGRQGHDRVLARPPARRPARRRRGRGAARPGRSVRPRRSAAARSRRPSSEAASGSSCRRWGLRGRSSSTERSSSSRTTRRRPTTWTACSRSFGNAGQTRRRCRRRSGGHGRVRLGRRATGVGLGGPRARWRTSSRSTCSRSASRSSTSCRSATASTSLHYRWVSAVLSTPIRASLRWTNRRSAQ